MSLQVAIPLGIASALVYGTSIVVQHDVAHQQGETDAKGLVSLLRNPRWLLAIGGDFIGFLLQIGALATGPVVLIQPLVVLMLPVAMIAGYLMGGPRPSMLDYVGSALIIGGLGTFLAIVGQPAPSRVPGSRFMAMVILVVLTVGVVATISVQRAASVVRGALFGTVAGAYFGTLGVNWGRAKPPWTIKGVADIGWATGKYNHEYLGRDIAAVDLVHAGAAARYNLGSVAHVELHVDASRLIAPTLVRSVQEPTLMVGGAAIGLDWSVGR